MDYLHDNFKKIYLGGLISGVTIIKILRKLRQKDEIYENYDETTKDRYISGPSNITHYKLNNKEIYMFGEFHFPVNQCSTEKNVINVPVIFDYIIKSNPHVTIDFYLEKQDKSNPLLNYAIDMGDSVIPFPILLTREYFAPCGISYKACKKYWPNLRLHGIDVRQTNNYSGSIFMNVINRPHAKLAGGTGLMEWMYSKYLDPDTIFAEYKIDKQIEGIADEDLRQKLRNYALVELKKKIDKYKDTGYVSDMFALMALYVDIYTLGRIFRTFDKHDSKFIMIYVGDQHREIIHNFLNTIEPPPSIKQYGDVTILLEILERAIAGEITDFMGEFKKIPQCVNITDSELPYFETALKDLPVGYDNIVESNSKKALNAAYYAYYKGSNLFGSIVKRRRKSRKDKTLKYSNKSNKSKSYRPKPLRKSHKRSRKRSVSN